jgi:hypothetical protein
MSLDKSQIYIIDNFVPVTDQKKILQNILTFPENITYVTTNYNKNGLVSKLKINDPKYTQELSENQFVINLKQSKTFFLEILEKNFNIQIEKILRTKVNWIIREHINSKNGYYPPHTDSPEDHWVLIYYLNTSDGDTLMFEETQKEIPFDGVSTQTLHVKTNIEHKMGRGILFHGSRYHCGLPPIESPYRILVNHNFTIKNNP